MEAPVTCAASHNHGCSRHGKLCWAA